MSEERFLANGHDLLVAVGERIESWRLVCPVLSDYGVALADFLPDDKRQLLKVKVSALARSAASPDSTRRRAYLIADWTARRVLPRTDSALATAMAVLAEAVGEDVIEDAARSAATAAFEATIGSAHSWSDDERQRIEAAVLDLYFEAFALD